MFVEFISTGNLTFLFFITDTIINYLCVTDIMTDSSMKDAMREAFSKKVGKTFANNNYVAFNNVESFEIGVYRMVLAEQLMRFYNAIESSAYDYRD